MNYHVDGIFILIKDIYPNLNLKKKNFEHKIQEKLSNSIKENETDLTIKEKYNEIATLLIYEWINDKFEDLYNRRKFQKCSNLLSYIDVNYNDGLILLRVVQDNDIEMLQKLLDMKPTVDLTETLEIAMYNGNLEQVKLLISYGANPANLNSSSAMYNHKKITQFLLCHEKSKEFFGEYYEYALKNYSDLVN
ncbi:hypothetical protein QLL95_gp0185 [Cotonvirus japonicus]|uniref:Ankyrin repeat protein n=1 Tax=Cotonvirus japonicus TaxID=2811091 RepID=A0ABM7NRA1_9VIRU|nr:hypothetical protein QLL95_gp0185 [Cotonvirus japonicus]BCS82674.1 hypothetical protein [Cotonvirus japonicus]